MTHRPDNQARDELEENAQPEVKRQTARSAEQATDDPAAERGERLDGGKTVARSGKESGHVPGASEPKAKSG